MKHEERIEKFLEVIRHTTHGDTSVYCPVTEADDMLDSLAGGLNAMIDEIKREAKRSEKYMLRLANKNKKLHELTAALQQSEKYHRTFFEKSEGFMCTHDLEGNFLSVNEAGAGSIGYSPAELVGTNLKNILDPVAKALFSDYLETIIAKKSSKGLMRVVARNGEYRIWLYHNHLYNGCNEQYVIGTAQDITERVVMEEQLRRAKEAAEESEKIKEQFLANTSHEIRTPMNAIIGFTELLLQTSLGEDQKEYLHIIKNSGENLLVIINDILDLSKIRSGKIHLEKTDFALPEVINSVLVLFQQRAKDTSIRLGHHIDGEVPLMLNGDSGRLKQVLINLLGNAFKFTEKGSITLNIRLSRENKNGSVLEFEVQDTGIGIPKNKLEAVFESFTQASNDTTRKYGGTGLGLTIVKNIIELQGGSIRVESSLGVGSRFIFTLPVEKAAGNAKMIRPIAQEEGQENKLSLKNIRVLLVEDNKVNQRLARIILGKTGCIIETADDGLEAIEKLKTSRYDIILMDVDMPRMDGYETTSYIRTQLSAPLNKIPIIAMTAHALSYESNKCIKAGMDDYISKPFVQEVLFNKIARLISGANPDTIVTYTSSPGMPSSTNRINLDSIRLSVGEDEKVVLEMIDLFCKHIPVMMEEIKIQALNGNWKLLGQAAHKIKPTIALLGVPAFTAIIESIENISRKETDVKLIPSLVDGAGSMAVDVMEQLGMERNQLLKQPN